MKHFFPLKYLFFFFSIVVANYDGLLQVANLFILGNEKCNQYLKGKITVNESEICAVAETIGAGPCEVNIAVPNTFLAISFLKKENYWRFFIIIILIALNLYIGKLFELQLLEYKSAILCQSEEIISTSLFYHAIERFTGILHILIY